MSNKKSIKRITARGIIGRYDYDINFMTSESNMKAIYSENGHGKTNLLRLISYITSYESEGLQKIFSIPFKDIEIYTVLGRVVCIKDGNKTCRIDIYNKETNEYSMHVLYINDIKSVTEESLDDEIVKKYQDIAIGIYAVTGNSVLLSTNRLNDLDSNSRFISRARMRRPGLQGSALGEIEDNSAGIIVDAALYELHNSLVRNAQRAAIISRGRRGVYSQITEDKLGPNTKESQGISAKNARNDLMNKIKSIDGVKGLVDKYKLINFDEFNSIKNTINLARINHGEFKNLHSILIPYFESLKERIDDIIPAAALIESFIDSINTMFSDKEIRFSIQRGFEIFATDGPESFEDNGGGMGDIKPSMLSNGEKHLIFLLSKVIVSATREDSLLIIDEPEISLGIRWQRLFIKYIQECTIDSNLQIIMATHSPLILNDYEDIDVSISENSLISRKSNMRSAG